MTTATTLTSQKTSRAICYAWFSFFFSPMGCGGRVMRRGTITKGKANWVESAVLGNHFDLTITIYLFFKWKKISRTLGLVWFYFHCAFGVTLNHETWVNIKSNYIKFWLHNSLWLLPFYMPVCRSCATSSFCKVLRTLVTQCWYHTTP